MLPAIGFLVPPPDWRARIVGVYAKAVSLLHEDGALISLVRGKEDMEARAIALEDGWEPFSRNAGQAFERADEDNPSFVDYRRTESAAGEKSARLTLFVAGNHGTRLFHLALDKAERWDPRDELRKSCSEASGPEQGLRQALAASRELLESALAQSTLEERPGDGIGGIGPFAQSFTRLKERKDFPACLVGFGPGTTPAGDDWLAGFLAALELRDCVVEPLNAIAGLRKDITLRLSRTSAAGRSLLLGALAGAPPAYLLRLRHACLRGEADGGSELNHAIAAALRHGASSGRDSLEGFKAGLEGILDFAPRE